MKTFSIVVVQFIFLLNSFAPVVAKEAATHSITATVYYVTNRKFTGTTFSEDRGTDQHHSCGSAELLIPVIKVRPDMRIFFAQLKPYNWVISNQAGADYKQISCKRLTLETTFDTIAKSMAMAKQDELTIMVHGYCNSFQDSLVATATLESYLKGAVIDYTWPAAKTAIPTPFHYNRAQTNVAWAQQPFSDFVKSLLEKFPNSKINIVCHSMGSRLVVGMLHDLYPNGSDKPRFEEIVFASPDFDEATFANRAIKTLSSAQRVTLFVNPNDKAMKFSCSLAGYKRAGAPTDLVDKLSESQNVNVIDFSGYGGGITGHSVPFSIISTFHKYHRLGGGYKLRHMPMQIVKVGTYR